MAHRWGAWRAVEVARWLEGNPDAPWPGCACQCPNNRPREPPCITVTQGKLRENSPRRRAWRWLRSGRDGAGRRALYTLAAVPENPTCGRCFGFPRLRIRARCGRGARQVRPRIRRRAPGSVRPYDSSDANSARRSLDCPPGHATLDPARRAGNIPVGARTRERGAQKRVWLSCTKMQHRFPSQLPCNALAGRGEYNPIPRISDCGASFVLWYAGRPGAWGMAENRGRENPARLLI